MTEELQLNFGFLRGVRRNVGIGEMIVSDSPDDLLVAPNLGSCVGVAIYDHAHRRGALIHCLLPSSKADAQKAADRPCMYVDTGVALLIDSLLRRGASKSGLKVFAAGGSAINDTKGVFEIGNRNITILRKLLWKNNILLTASDLGGEVSRTLALCISTGRVVLKPGGGQWADLV